MHPPPPKHYYSTVAASAGPDADATQLKQMSGAMRNAISTQSLISNNSRQNDGFVTQKRRRPRKPPVRGNANTQGPLKGAPEPSRDIFVYRVLPETDETMVGKYMFDSNVVIREIKRISKDEARFKSFKVTITRPDLPKVLKPDFFPEGVCVTQTMMADGPVD